MGKGLKTTFWGVLLGQLFGLALALLAGSAYPQAVIQGIPENAWKYAPVLVEKQKQVWPSVSAPWTLAGLVEQESCYGLAHKTCWNPNTTLKTSREYGFGLGQITIAYDAKGKERFNRFTELKQEHASLRSWAWADRFNPNFQLLALVEDIHNRWNKVPTTRNEEDHWNFTLCSYNGGLSGLLQDVKLCRRTAGCDPEVWYGNVEKHSLKSKTPHPEYKKSFYQINREYVKNIMRDKRNKYARFWE